jgi:hypothetical protein|tara:strand:- start:247 stop:621 length:375 start_codon:yes stop_codon:yes gene_type:complete
MGIGSLAHKNWFTKRNREIILDSLTFYGIINNMNETTTMNSKSKVMKYFRIMALVALGYATACYVHLVYPAETLNLPPECVVLYNYAQSFRERSNALAEENIVCLEKLKELEDLTFSQTCEEGP